MHMKYGIIDKRALGEARSALKFRLKQQGDEPLNHKFGPPSVMGGAPQQIHRHLEDKFWAQMLKEGVVVRHPYGGYMHPRFAQATIPSIEDVKAAVIAELPVLYKD